MRRLLPALALASCAAASACASYDSFGVPAAELRGRVDTIAIAPLRVSSDLLDRADARPRIEARAAAALAGGGFRVVSSAEFEKLWRAAAAAVGNVYDPVSGKLDEERYEAVEAAVYRDLAAASGVDAVLYLAVELVDFPATQEWLQYCGTEGDAYWPPEDGLGAFDTATLARAACLYANLFDLENRRLYSIRHGLATIETFAHQTHAERPLDQRLNDAALAAAIERTLGPLARSGR